jgi:transcriptional regulator with XRE-family HTH domain
LVKIGITTDPIARIRALETQGGFQASRAWVSFPTSRAQAVEMKAHADLSESRVIGEWFSSEFDSAVKTVESALSSDFTIYATDIGERIAELISQRGVTYSVVSSQAGVSKQAVCDWIKGRSTNIRPNNLIAIADYFGVSVRWIVTGERDAQDIVLSIPVEHRAQALRMLEAFAASYRVEH